VTQRGHSPFDFSDGTVNELIRSAKKRGYVTLAQISCVLPSRGVSSEQLKSIVSSFGKMGLDVVDIDKAEPESVDQEESVARTSRRMLSETGREPMPEEIAEKLHMPLEKVRKVLRIAKEPLSLETPIGDEGESHLGDLIEDKNALLPIDAAIQSDLRETTTRVLASLTPREERIVRMRFGLGMNSDHAGGSRPTIFSNARANSADRGEGTAETQTP